MTTVTIRLPDELLHEADQRAQALHIPRAEYIRRAIESLNTEILSHQRRERMMKASRRVREDSMRINDEYDAIEDTPHA